MKWYKCLVAGENFPGELLNDTKPVGFYVTRFVQGNSPGDAEMAALDLLRGEESLSLPEGVSPLESAKVYFEEITEVPESEVPSIPMGFSFFPMDSQD